MTPATERALVVALRWADTALLDMMNTWLDYHDRHSLTEPVTGRSANAYDKAADARAEIDAALSAYRQEQHPEPSNEGTDNGHR